MEKQKKAEVIDSLKNIFESPEVSSVIVTQYQGLNVSQLSELRSGLREVGASFNVVKNNLAKIAVSGTDYEGLESHLSGPAALVVSNDPVAASKKIINFSKENEKLLVIGGIVDGKAVGESDVKLLSTMPSLDELRAKLVGVISAPARNVVCVTNAPASQLARVIGAYSEK